MRPNTTKAEIGAQIARDFGPIGITQGKCQTVINAFTELIGEYLAAGREVQIRKFGSWYPKIRKAKPAQNPRTGKRVIVPTHLTALFRFSPEVTKGI